MTQDLRKILPAIFNRDFADSLFRFPANSGWEEICQTESNQGLSVYEENDQFVVEAALPGLKDSEIEVNIHKGVLWIKGEKKETETDKPKKYYRKTCRSFSYSVALPDQIEDREESEASYENGVLKIAFQKAKAASARRINIKKTL